jgi:hypothetical protein
MSPAPGAFCWFVCDSAVVAKAANAVATMILNMALRLAARGDHRRQKWRTFVRSQAAAIVPRTTTISDPGGTLSSIVLQHLLQQR